MIIVIYLKGELHNDLVYSGFKGYSHQGKNPYMQQNNAFAAFIKESIN